MSNRVSLEEVFSDRSKHFHEMSERELDRIRKTDALINELLTEIRKLNLSKQELAESVDLNPAFVRRFFSQKASNPTLKTVLAIASELGYELKLVKSS